MHRRSLLVIGASLALPRAARADNDGTICAPEHPCPRVEVLVGNDHGHRLEVPVAHVLAAEPRRYDLRGVADHPHVLEVTARDFARLAAGEPVRLVTSRDAGHAHRLRLTCAPLVPPPERVSACLVEIGGTDGHELIVPLADLASKKERTYDIQGVAIHTHGITLSAASFERLRAGENVVLTTSPGGGHTHVVSVRWPAAKRPTPRP